MKPLLIYSVMAVGLLVGTVTVGVVAGVGVGDPVGAGAGAALFGTVGGATAVAIVAGKTFVTLRWRPLALA